MNERIILAPGVGGSELLRALAKNGVNTIGLRVMSSVELARFALMKSGISVTEEFLAHNEQPSVIYSFLKEIPYFKTASYADAENIASTLNVARGLIKNDDAELKEILSNGEFPEKNTALLSTFKMYEKECITAGKIDSIGLIRKAINEAKPITAKATISYIREFPIQPIDEALLEAVSDGAYNEISLAELFGAEQKALSEIEITEGYGEINEVQDIINDIYSRGLSLDKCLVACAGKGYSQVFCDIARMHDIPITFGSGVPISNSNPARLLKLMYEWNTTGYNGIDALRRIINSEAIDRKELFKTVAGTEELKRREIEDLVKTAGALRISLNAADNKQRIDALKELKGETELLGRVEKLATELARGMAEFIERFALIRPEPIGRIDQSAVNVITSTMKAYERYAPDGDLNEIIPELLNKTVCSENSKEGALHITSIQSAMGCMRENLYVCGLSASNFPGSPTENYLMLDNDLKRFAELGEKRDAGVDDNQNSNIDEDKLPTSENKIKSKKKSLDNLLGLAASLGVDVKLSYSGFSLSELKAQNPSSVLFGIAESINPDITMEEFKESIKKAEYFSSKIDANSLVGDEYSKGSEIDFARYESEKMTAEQALERAWSPSALNIFYQCPRHFYLSRILRIPEEDSDDPFTVLSAADVGTLAHSMMEELAANFMDEPTFLAEASKAFDNALIARPPMHAADADRLKDEFLKMMKTAYEADPHNEVLTAETEYKFEHPSGVKLHGYPDRVEKTANGECIIADFKTMRKIEHVQDDFNTCMQVVIYAWMCEQAGIDISSCEYRYLRKGRSVSCKYDDTKRDELDNFLRYFKQCIENNEFPRNKNEVSCKYCKMADICEWGEV